MIYKKIITHAEKRLNYLINEALSLHVRGASRVLSVIADEFSIRTGTIIKAWINDNNYLTYPSDDDSLSNYIKIKNILNDKKVTDNSWFGPADNIFYKTFGSSRYGSFSIVIQCPEQDTKEKKAAIASLAVRIFKKIDI